MWERVEFRNGHGDCKVGCNCLTKGLSQFRLLNISFQKYFLKKWGKELNLEMDIGIAKLVVIV